MTFHSAEIRWWSEREDDLKSWFHALNPQGDGRRESSRTDYYFKLSSSFTGIKIREGNLEVKGRLRFENNSFGKVEHYRKESHDTELRVQDFLPGELIAVKKTRWLKVFDASAIMWILDSDPPKKNCTVEFAKVEIEQRKFYTICFEASDPESKNPQKVLTEALTDRKVPALNFEKKLSAGYSEFLNKLNEGKF